MTHRLCFFLSLVLATTFFAAEMAADETSAGEMSANETVEWHERTVDLYADAQLRHDASVLRSSSDAGDIWAVLLPESVDAWILHPGGEVTQASADSFTWTGPLDAMSPPMTGEASDAVGTWTVVDGGWVAKTKTVALLALPHQGPAGAVDTDTLWSAVPSWKRLMEAWQPEADGEPEAMEVLGSLGTAKDMSFEAVFGTWCGDSRRSVPKLLAAAGELELDVSLVAIQRGFASPLHYARDQRITNVPTILVKRNGLEIGRFIERPRSASVITDLAAILQRRPAPPPDAFSEGDALLAKGEYVLRSAAGLDVGRETWSLFHTEDGHQRLGSRQIEESGAVTELWQRWTPAAEGGRMGFVEVTRDARGERSRTRLSRRVGEDGNDAVHALTRGDAGGIVEQDLVLPADAVVVSPGIAAAGLAWQAAGRPESASMVALTIPRAGDGFAARQDDAEWSHVARVELYEPSLGDVAADHVVLRRGGARPATTEWWIHAELGVPVRAVSEGVTAELVWLEVTGPSGSD